MIAVLPDPKDHEIEDEYNAIYYGNGFEEAIEAGMVKLREAAGNCPACILAALRQRGIPVPVAKSFSFTKEMESIWADINTRNLQDERESEWS